MKKTKFDDKQLISTTLAFISSFQKKFQSLWQENQYNWFKNNEGIEGMIIKHLYDKQFLKQLYLIIRLFSIFPIEKDLKAYYYFHLFDFIKLKHLDVSLEEIVYQNMNSAVSSKNFRIIQSYFNYLLDLQKINEHKTPRDKIICFANCLNKIDFILEKMKESNGQNLSDKQFPILVYILIKSKLKRIKSNISFVKQLLFLNIITTQRTFRQQKLLTEKDTQYIEQISQALNFIEKIDSSTIQIESEEFNMLFSAYSEKAQKIYEEQQEELKQKKVIEEVKEVKVIQNINQIQSLQAFFNSQAFENLKCVQNSLSLIKASPTLMNKTFQNMTINEFTLLHKECTLLHQQLKQVQSQMQNSFEEFECIKEISDKQEQQNGNKRFFGLI